jgi:predicted nucleic acid-binding protein
MSTLTALLDTNILIELYRKNASTQAWLVSQEIASTSRLGISSITWLEFMEGARGKAGQERCLEMMAKFTLERLKFTDQDWAMAQLQKFRFSHGASFKDCLIASAAFRLQIPLVTRNVKDFAPLLPRSLIVSPY